MSFVKTFLFGAAVAYGIQYLTKKRPDGSSILSDFVDDPPEFVNKAKDYAADTVDQVKQAAKEKMAM